MRSDGRMDFLNKSESRSLKYPIKTASVPNQDARQILNELLQVIQYVRSERMSRRKTC